MNNEDKRKCKVHISLDYGTDNHIDISINDIKSDEDKSIINRVLNGVISDINDIKAGSEKYTEKHTEKTESDADISTSYQLYGLDDYPLDSLELIDKYG